VLVGIQQHLHIKGLGIYASLYNLDFVVPVFPEILLIMIPAAV
jgi:hypothetical protein